MGDAPDKNGVMLMNDFVESNGLLAHHEGYVARPAIARWSLFMGVGNTDEDINTSPSTSWKRDGMCSPWIYEGMVGRKERRRIPEILMSM